MIFKDLFQHKPFFDPMFLWLLSFILILYWSSLGTVYHWCNRVQTKVSLLITVLVTLTLTSHRMGKTMACCLITIVEGWHLNWVKSVGSLPHTLSSSSVYLHKDEIAHILPHFSLHAQEMDVTLLPYSLLWLTPFYASLSKSVKQGWIRTNWSLNFCSCSLVL